MGLFWGNTKCEVDTSKQTGQEQSASSETKPDIPKEEWIWVDGYKGTDENMKCRDFQFELNVEYEHDEEVKECASGFHMCKQLQHVFNFYQWGNSTRYFKVKALVRKSDDAKYGKREDDNPYSYLLSSGYVNKLAAKKIILLEEITKCEDVYRIIKDDFKMLESYDEFKSVSDYSSFRKEKFDKGLTKHHTSVLASVLFDDIVKMEHGDKKLLHTLKLSESLYQEGVSSDMAIYLLLNSIK